MHAHGLVREAEPLCEAEASEGREIVGVEIAAGGMNGAGPGA